MFAPVDSIFLRVPAVPHTLILRQGRTEVNSHAPTSCDVYHCTTALLLRRDPVIHALFQYIQRQCARIQHLIMESSDIELIT